MAQALHKEHISTLGCSLNDPFPEGLFALQDVSTHQTGKLIGQRTRQDSLQLASCDLKHFYSQASPEKANGLSGNHSELQSAIFRGVETELRVQPQKPPVKIPADPKAASTVS